MPPNTAVENNTNLNFFILSEYALRVLVIRSKNYRLCDSTLTAMAVKYEKMQKSYRSSFTAGIVAGSAVSLAVVLILKIIIN